MASSFCDDRCTNASGKSCDCECGGANHGGSSLSAIDRTGHDSVVSLDDRELRREEKVLQSQAARLRENKDKFVSKDEVAKEADSIQKRAEEIRAEIRRRDQGGAELGSVSTGTTNPRDLIPEFRSVLSHLDQKSYRAHLDGYGDVTGDEKKDQEKGLDPEEADWALEDLFDRLNAVSPPGAHFGSHEGDGADFGFWLDHED